ncbi:hypothetical protein [Bradyrhizobium sp. LB11.1]|uniref:hypothetical protein n=1 Tax=Bradyrhizobium sp. LB11.1 TaxID=3156326 RepID=UPI00339AB1FF
MAAPIYQFANNANTILRALRLSLLALALSGQIAFAAGPGGGGPGPSPAPNPWIVLGPSITYSNGSVLLPQGVTGGDKGIGSINIAGNYYINGVSIGSLPCAQCAVKNATNTFSANQIININGGATPAAQSGMILQGVAASAATGRVEIDTFGAATIVTGVRANGTLASPTTLVANDEILSLNAWGYDGTSRAGPAGAVRLYAGATWSNTSHPTYIDFSTTIAGSTTLTSRGHMENDGGLTWPSTVIGGSKGSGTINASALYAAGAQVPAGPGAAVVGNIAYWSNTSASTLAAAPAFQAANPGNAALYSIIASPGAGNGVWNAMTVSIGAALSTAEQFGATRLQQAIVGTATIDVADTTASAYGVTGFGKSNSGLNANIIGVGGWGFCNGTNSSCWAGADSTHNLSQIVTNGGHDANSQIGREIDMNIWKKAAGAEPVIGQLQGLLITGSGDSTTNQGDAILINKLNVNTGAKWSNAFNSEAGAAVNAFVVGPVASSGTTLNSQNLIFQGVNGSGAILTSTIFADGGGDIFVRSPTSGSVVLGDSAGNYLVTSPGVGGAKITFQALNGGSAGIIKNDTAGNLSSVAQVAVAQGGTGIGSGTSGGIPYFNNTSTMASSGLLAANAVVVGGGAGAAPATVTTGTSVITALGVNIGSTGSMLLQGSAAALNAAPGNPTGTTSLSPTAKMMGLGSTCVITPVRGTRVRFTITGSINNNTAGDTATYRLAMGAGAVPNNGDAATGTTFGSAAVVTNPASGGGAVSLPFTATGLGTGLTPGSAYWFDMQIAAITGGTASIQSLGCVAEEMQ